MNDDRIIKTYVWHGERCFFVSTINRESSAAILPSPRYNETMVWEYNWNWKGPEGDPRGDWLYQGSDNTGSIGTHQRVVEAIHAGGLDALRGLGADGRPEVTE